MWGERVISSITIAVVIPRPSKGGNVLGAFGDNNKGDLVEKNSMCYEAILDLTTCLERLDDMMGIVGCEFWTYTRQL